MVGLYYRAAQLVHLRGMEVFRHLLPAAVAGAEIFIIFALFTSIRLNTHGSTNGSLLALSFLSVGAITFYVFKRCLEFASKVTEASRDFSRIPFLQEGSRFLHEDKVFLASCRPLALKVGDTFIITKESFPTISQDIILTTLINLLITF